MSGPVERSAGLASPLSVVGSLRDATRRAHREVEASSGVQRFFRGEFSPVEYLRLLGQFHAVYAALESGLIARYVPEPLPSALFERVRRLPALTADRAFWCRRLAVPLPALAEATDRYRDHLEALAAAKPDLLLAHLYVRYGGDLAGGQQLGRLARRHLGAAGQGAEEESLPEPAPGFAFYHFGTEEQTAALRPELWSALERHCARWDAPALQALTGEAEAAFRWSQQVLQGAFEAERVWRRTVPRQQERGAVGRPGSPVRAPGASKKNPARGRDFYDASG